MTFVDQSAEAIWKLMTTSSSLRCFHILNPHRLSLRELAEELDLEQMDVERFYKKFSGEKELLTHAAYIQNPHLLMTYPRNDQTEEILKKTGHIWKKSMQNTIKLYNV
ncbi:MAG: hypothetical protein PF518_02770 [Spirochaetaceae bacterium]|jgi:hypothetical protein|nr:hypothetical protein [Spirochaetaceae bacterium]